MIYLDSAATTLEKPDSVANAMRLAVGRLASPGRGGHIYALRAAETVKERPVSSVWTWWWRFFCDLLAAWG